MTVHKDFKQLVRQRARRTGESYAAARRSLLAKSQPLAEDSPEPSAAAAPPVQYDLWFTRGTKGYSGGPAKPTGHEHHRVTVAAGGTGSIHVVADVSFSNYGDHRFTVTADEDGCTSHFDYDTDVARVVVDARWTGDAWAGAIDNGGDGGDGGGGNDGGNGFVLPVSVRATVDAPPVPSVVARFLPLRLPREKGELAAHTPLPEDGFPAALPRGVKSWFPIMGVARPEDVVPRVIVGVGDEVVSLGGRRKVEAFRYDHVSTVAGDDGERRVLDSTWIDGDGIVVRYEQRGLVLVATSPPADA